MYTVVYHEKVSTIDIPKLSKIFKSRIKSAIENKLMTEPLRFGKFLNGSLFPFRSLRVGEYRVIFSIEPKNTIYVLLIEHRSIVYTVISKRK